MGVPSALRPFVGVLFVAALVTVPASTASAHTEFDFSLPTDGAVVPEPVDEITVGFTLPVTLVGNGFEVLDPQGNVLEPFAVTDDDRVFRLQVDPPLAGGEAAVRYEVRAEDGHVVTGGFRFTIDAPLPTTTPPTTIPPTTAPSLTSAPATSAPSVAAPTTVADTIPPTTSPAVADAVTTTAAAVVDPATSVASPDDDGSDTNMLLVGGAGVVALGAAGFLFARSRTSDHPAA